MPQRTPEQVREVLKQDQRTYRFDLKNVIKTTQLFLVIPQDPDFFRNTKDPVVRRT